MRFAIFNETTEFRMQWHTKLSPEKQTQSFIDKPNQVEINDKQKN